MKLKVLNTHTQLELREMNLEDSIDREGECFLGRSPQSGLTLDSPDVSRLHAKFAFEEGQYYFYDLGSSNGSLVNGKEAHPNQGYLLKPGDIIRVGEFVLILYPMGERSELPATVIGDPNATVLERRFSTIHSANQQTAAVSKSENDEINEIELSFSNQGFTLDQQVDSMQEGEEQQDEEQQDKGAALSLEDDVIEDGTSSELVDEKQLSSGETIAPSTTIQVGEWIEAEVPESEAAEIATPLQEEPVEVIEDLESFSQPEIPPDSIESIVSDSTEQLSESSLSSEVPFTSLVNHPDAIQLEETAESPESNAEIAFHINVDETTQSENTLPSISENGSSDESAFVLSADSSQPEASSVNVYKSVSPSKTNSVQINELNESFDATDSFTETVSNSVLDTDVVLIEEDESKQIEALEPITSEVEPSESIDIQSDIQSGIQSMIQSDDNDTLETNSSASEAEEATASEATNIPETEPLSESSSTEMNEDEVNQHTEVGTPISEQTNWLAASDETSLQLETGSEMAIEPTSTNEISSTAATSDTDQRTGVEDEESVTLERELTETDDGTPMSVPGTIQTTVETDDIAPSDGQRSDSQTTVISEKYVALLAHDSQIPALVELVADHQDFFSHCLTVATPGVSEVLKQKTGLEVSHQTPAIPPGGYQTVNSWITADKILAVIFLRDFLTPQATQANDEAFSRSCNIRQILFASNLPTAGALLHYLQNKTLVTEG